MTNDQLVNEEINSNFSMAKLEFHTLTLFRHFDLVIRILGQG